jgi:hypothetical protein
MGSEASISDAGSVTVKLPRKTTKVIPESFSASSVAFMWSLEPCAT